MKKNLGTVLFVLFLLAGLFALPYIFGDGDVEDMSYSNFVQLVEEEKVKEVSELPPYLFAKTKNGESVRVKMLSSKLLDDSSLMESLKRSSADVRSKDVESPNILIWISSFLPMILMVLFFVFLSRRMGMGKMPGAKPSDIGRMSSKKVTFADVAGLEEAKRDLMEIVEFLKNPFKFLKLGARIPKGVLMLGEPGTGKTLLAKAVAGEAGVPFFNISGSEFVEMFVGVGASRVRDLFNKAKKHAPCIVFIDEIDAVARKRGTSHGGGNDEREQTLNQLLVEMDGFSENQNVIVIAATNRAEVLDEAILRPGRFDRRVSVDPPTFKERVEILLVHSRNKPLCPDVKLENVAKKTSGMVGADLENILNEAAIIAARKDSDEITSKHIEEAVEVVVAGPERKSKVMSPEEKKVVAYHEAGHAIVAYMLPNTRPIHKISIIPRGKSALGYVIRFPTEDKFLWSKEDFLNDIRVSIGGRVAEELMFKEITSGAHNDIDKATSTAKNMVAIYGMSQKIGPVALFSERELAMKRGDTRNFSNETSLVFDEEVKSIILSCYEDAKEIIMNNFGKLKAVAEYLLKEEIIFEHEVANIIESSV